MLSSLQRVVGRLSLAVLLTLGTSALAHAESFGNFLAVDQFNTFEDDSREAFFDTGTGNSGTFGVGDVVVGVVQIEHRSTPSTVSGLTIGDLVPGVSSGAMVALLPSTAAGYSTNLITNAPAIKRAALQ